MLEESILFQAFLKHCEQKTPDPSLSERQTNTPVVQTFISGY
ncbi:hypothetical protein M103_1574 [Bacteroides fragilis str. 1007-1-F |nr:hypothetical protein M103_1574 [Bacteroides fragilis str. 1007-1-F \